VVFTDRCGFETVEYDVFLHMSVDTMTGIGIVRLIGCMCAWACGVVICSYTEGVRVICIEAMTHI
jgi:hypothetical protein